MRLRLTPQDVTFFELFGSLAATLVDGAGLLAQLLGQDQQGREVLAQELREAEHRADEATHAIMRRLNSSFITPFDRQDIYALASGLDDCMDHMEAAADLVVLYQVGDLPSGVTDQVTVLQRQAEVTAEAMPRLRQLRDLADYWVEINRLENQADRSYRRLLGEIFADVVDVVRLIKLREIVHELELAADAFEKVAHTIEMIAVKES